MQNFALQDMVLAFFSVGSGDSLVNEALSVTMEVASKCISARVHVRSIDRAEDPRAGWFYQGCLTVVGSKAGRADEPELWVRGNLESGLSYGPRVAKQNDPPQYLEPCRPDGRSAALGTGGPAWEGPAPELVRVQAAVFGGGAEDSRLVLPVRRGDGKAGGSGQIIVNITGAMRPHPGDNWRVLWGEVESDQREHLLNPQLPHGRVRLICTVPSRDHDAMVRVLA